MIRRFRVKAALFFRIFMHFDGINLDDMEICEYNEVLNSGFS